ncbi:ALQxL family class IV lanthipeptide [Streptomyces aureocirculatus]
MELGVDALQLLEESEPEVSAWPPTTICLCCVQD